MKIATRFLLLISAHYGRLILKCTLLYASPVALRDV